MAGWNTMLTGASEGRGGNWNWNWVLEKPLGRLDWLWRSPHVSRDQSGGVPENAWPGPGNERSHFTSANPSQEFPQQPFWGAEWECALCYKDGEALPRLPSHARLPTSECQLSPLGFLTYSSLSILICKMGRKWYQTHMAFVKLNGLPYITYLEQVRMKWVIEYLSFFLFFCFPILFVARGYREACLVSRFSQRAHSLCQPQKHC